jgi:hypothetical protein
MKTVLVDYRIEDIELINLQKLGFQVAAVPPSNILYEAVCGHPDMLLHIVDSSTVIVHREMTLDFIVRLKDLNVNVVVSQNSLQRSYPNNIILNAVSLDNLFIHNVRYTDAELLYYVKNKKIRTVKQGYTKCSTAVVSSNALMTSDKGIAKCAQEEGLDVLLLPPGDILLPGLDYGFIGGCCGLLEDGLLAFYGDLEHYTYGKKILDYLKKHKVEPLFLRNGKLIDRGSLLAI